jgi:hypothetical protein
METKPRDPIVRWWMRCYVAVVTAAIAVILIDAGVFGSHPNDYVATHPELRSLDRCFFVLTLVLAFVVIAVWLVCLWKLFRDDRRVLWIWILFLTTICAPFGVVNGLLGRVPWAAELAATLRDALFFPVFFFLIGCFALLFKQLREESRKEVEAYKARRAPKPHDAVDLAPAAGDAVRDNQ